MHALSPRPRKVRPPRVSMKERQFETLLRRAADFLKSREQSSGDKTLPKKHVG
jgi:hypothetical protein